MAQQAQRKVARDDTAPFLSDESLELPVDVDDLEFEFCRTVNAQFDRYMAQARGIPIMSREDLSATARTAYECRYEMMKVLSKLPACHADLVERFRYQRSKKLKLGSLLTGVGNQTPKTRDYQFQYNLENGPDSAPRPVADEATLAAALSAMESYYDEFQSCIDADKVPSLAQELMTLYRMSILRIPIFDAHCALLVSHSDLIQDFMDLTNRLFEEEVASFILNNLESGTMESVVTLLDDGQRTVWQIEAHKARKLCDSQRLKPQQIVELRAAYDQHLVQYRKHINEIVQANLLLAARATLRNSPTENILFDACQEANEGLITAAERYSYWRGYAFSTYAMMWIRRRLTEYYDRSSNTWAVPFSVTLKAQKVRNARQELARERQTLEEKVTATEIAHHLKLDVSVVNDTLQAYKSPITDPLVLDYYVGSDTDGCAAFATEENLKEVVRKAVASLPERKREVCRMRMGIGIPRVMTLTEVAAKLNITGEAVRQAEKDGMARLKKGRYGRLLAELYQYA